MTPTELQRRFWREWIPTLAVVVLVLFVTWLVMGCSEPAPCRVEVTRVTVAHEVPADVDGVLQDVLADLERAGELLDVHILDRRDEARAIIQRNTGRLQGLLHHSQGKEPGQGAEP